MIRVLSLFSGIGAFEVALDEENIEWELDHYCEIDKYACMSYNMIHRTTDEDNLKDVTNIDYSKIGHIDLVTYGFPCQDISLAGNQKGFFDEEGNLTRSGLFFNAADVIRHTKPKFAIFENVKNLTGKKFKAEFETVLNTLDEIGYNTYWKVLNAKDYGIPQNRERVFGISIRKDIDHGYEFPEPVYLYLRLKDMLEENVDEKYYLPQNKIEKIAKRFDNTPHTLLGGEQKHQSVKKDGICTTLTSSMGVGGGYVPMINEPKIQRVGKTKSGGQKSEIIDSEGICSCLSATDYKQPKQILEPKIEQVGTIDLGNNESNNRVYSPDGLSPTLNTMQGGHRQPKIIEPCIVQKPHGYNKGGLKELAPSLTISSYEQNNHIIEPMICASRGRNPENPSSRVAGEPTEQRIEVNTKGLANTLTTVQKDNYVLEPKIIDDTQGFDGVREYDNYSPTLRSARNGLKVEYDMRIRKLTPRECWRLMGFRDKYFDRVHGVSNSQLYKQAGNSIVVDVLRAIFRELKNQYPSDFEDIWEEEL